VIYKVPVEKNKTLISKQKKEPRVLEHPRLNNPFLKTSKKELYGLTPYIYNLLSLFSMASNYFCPGSKGVLND